MGCVCSKGVSTSPNRRKEKKPKKKSLKRFNVASKEDAVCVEVDNGGIDATTRLILTENAERSAGSTPPSREEEAKPNGAFEKSSEFSISHGSRRDAGSHVMNGGQPQISRVFSVRDGVDGAQVVAGWPSWLSAVAGEAIKGWVPRKADSFERLDKIGQGTYSSVYRARDLESGKIVALKKVRFVNMDPESVRFMAREILILRRLDHPNIMKLEGLVTSRVSCNLYLVFEYMEHDLTGPAASPKVKFTEPQIKCYMQQLLRGLDHCHSRGVLHRDIKGSNLLIDNNGNLKIGDFGLATFYRANQKQPLTSRVVTLWYRPPELLLGATDYGPAVDLWSAGCILAELFAGKPIMPGRTEVEQLHKIFKLCGSPSEEYWKKSKLPHATIFKPQQPYKRTVAETFKDFPPSVLSLLDSLLAFEPECRGTAASALQSEFFTTKPLPCDPSALPKYPPSKEFDAKNRDEEAKRQKAAGGRGRDLESSRKGSKESKAVPAPEANAELPSSIQRWQAQSNNKSNSEKFFPEDAGASGFPFDHSGRSLYKSVLAHNAAPKSLINMPVGEAWGHDGSVGQSSKYSSELGIHKAYKPHGPAEHLSRFSNSVGVNGSSRFDLSRNDSARSHWPGERLHAKDHHLRGADSSHRWMGGPSVAHKKDEVTSGVEYPMGYGSKKSKINYSGPLLPPDGSIEDMLKEHERQIQQAVRKAREKNRNMKAYRDNLHAESLLQYVGNAR